MNIDASLIQTVKPASTVLQGNLTLTQIDVVFSQFHPRVCRQEQGLAAAFAHLRYAVMTRHVWLV